MLKTGETLFRGTSSTDMKNKSEGKECKRELGKISQSEDDGRGYQRLPEMKRFLIKNGE